MNATRGFKKILLATDGSETAEEAIEATIALGRPSSATVLAVHVWNLEVNPDDVQMDVESRDEAARLVVKTVDLLRRGGMTAEARVCPATGAGIAETISVVARDFKADLVVLGSRGLSDWQSIFKPSVSHKVLSAVDCPVLVVRGVLPIELRAPRRELVAIAGAQ